MAHEQIPYRRTLARVASALDAVGVRYVVTGSMAAGFYGTPRMSADIDVLIEAHPGSSNGSGGHDRHVRAPDHVAVVLGSASFAFTSQSGEVAEAHLETGQALFVEGGEHSTKNTGSTKLRAVLLELK